MIFRYVYQQSLNVLLVAPTDVDITSIVHTLAHGKSLGKDGIVGEFVISHCRQLTMPYPKQSCTSRNMPNYHEWKSVKHEHKT